MRDFLKSRLQNSPGGVILELLGLIHPATSGNRSVNTMTISRIKTHFAFIFCGFEEVFRRNPERHDLLRGISFLPNPLFYCPDKQKKALHKKSLTARRLTCTLI